MGIDNYNKHGWIPYGLSNFFSDTLWFKQKLHSYFETYKYTCIYLTLYYMCGTKLIINYNQTRHLHFKYKSNNLQNKLK